MWIGNIKLMLEFDVKCVMMGEREMERASDVDVKCEKWMNARWSRTS